MLPSAQCRCRSSSPQTHSDTISSETKMQMSSTSKMIHAYKFLRPCTNYPARTRSNAARSLCVGSPYHSHRSFIPTIQRDERVLVVWSDNLHSIIQQCLEFEEHLIKLVWTQRHSLMALDIGPSIPATPAAASASTSLANSASDVQLNEKPKEQESAPAPFPAGPADIGNLPGSPPTRSAPRNRDCRTTSSTHSSETGRWPLAGQ